MADETNIPEDSSINFIVKSSNDAKFPITFSLSTPISELKQKLSSPEYADTPVERQRLIYSGRVLKDNETLNSYNVKEGHTIHLVKSAASNQRATPTTQASSTTPSAGATPSQPAAGVPTNLAAGTGNNPLAGLTGARYAGFAQLPGAGLFGPDGGMGPPPDADTMLNMLENPQFQSSLNEALQNPAVIDMMIQQHPQMQNMGPGMRQMLQSPEFRRMLTDPNQIRQMLQMQRALGLGGGMGGEGAFPAPGVTNTTLDGQNAQQPNAQENSFGQAPANPFASLFNMNPAAAQAPGPQDSTTTTEGQGNGAAQNPLLSLLGAQAQGQAANPFQGLMRNPELMGQMMQAMGGGGEAGTNPMASLFGGGAFGSPPPPVDNRPPEERFADQLRQLNDMGFYEFERNIAALRRSGGSVQGAIQYLLGD